MRNARDAAPAAEGETSSSVVESPTSTPATPSPPIKMEVGIEDCLHIEFEYDKAAYHLSDVVLGRISFLLVRIRLKHMELEVRRRETSGSGASAKSEATTLCKYEIMDGAPVRGETVPIRLCLAPYDLTPTYLNVHNKVKSFERERESEKNVFFGFFLFGFFLFGFLFPCLRSISHLSTHKKTQNSKLSSPPATSSTWCWSTRRTGGTSSSRRSRCGGRGARTSGRAGEGPGAAAPFRRRSRAEGAGALFLPPSLLFLPPLLLLPCLLLRRRRRRSSSRRSSCRGRRRRRQRRQQLRWRRRERRSGKGRRRRRLRQKSSRRPRCRRLLEFFRTWWFSFLLRQSLVLYHRREKRGGRSSPPPFL